jgi:hypothetical protein
MLWGLLILGLMVVCVTIALFMRAKTADQRAAADRQRRFAIKDTGERVPMAPIKPSPTPAAIPDDGTPIFAPRPTANADQAPSVDEPASVPAPTTGRLVNTPDGEMILTSPPFALRDAIFSQKSGRFVNMISRRAPAWVMACPRVRLDSLLTPTKPDGRDPADWRDWRRRVRLRSIDLVLCDRRSWKPLVAILFDHRRSIDVRRIAGGQDRMIDEVLGAVGLPLLRLTGEFERDWPLVKPYLEESILPHTADEQILEASMRTNRIDGDTAVTLLRMDQDKGWMLE